ncbi:flavin-dependent thymidylate synthase [Pectobacterium phage A38]|uniref:Flavin-dependent thymidylate synthase n=2 Tax=Cbunavirus A41 TaxID=2845779 RepID=A0A7I6I628_9CAUD|nr:thymidylate synthase [Pectobacterium phage phiA41]APD19113.1 flavin-dependent thymidylate synthase [Pectobacterium phage A38]ARB10998.1 flavin-dependent thymidylate synthase [Pectobacterium phage phiA41]
MSQQSAIYVDHMGTDKSVVNAARLSFGIGAVKPSDQPLVQKDINLIKFLAYGLRTEECDKVIDYIARGFDGEDYDGIGDALELYNQIRHQATHWTPFAHTAISISMKAPIPIRTQCFKHKQGLVENEESRRYITSTPEIFLPEFRTKPKGSIKQGSGGLHPMNELIQREYIAQTTSAVRLYEQMLGYNVAPEQARLVLPQGAMVNWLWTGNLFAYANFYNKRSDPHAQGENQELAELVKAVVEPLYPVSWAALTR